MERLVPFLIESKMGHDTEEVPESKVPEKVEELLDEGKMATIEKKDGTTEVVAEKKDDWADTFKDTKSVVGTGKLKGG